MFDREEFIEKLKLLKVNEEYIEKLEDLEDYMIEVIEDLIDYEDLEGYEIEEVIDYFRNGDYVLFTKHSEYHDWELREDLLNYYLEDGIATGKLINNLSGDLIDKIISEFLFYEYYLEGFENFVIFYR